MLILNGKHYRAASPEITITTSYNPERNAATVSVKFPGYFKAVTYLLDRFVQRELVTPEIINVILMAGLIGAGVLVEATPEEVATEVQHGW